MRVRVGMVVAVALLPLLTGCIDLFDKDDVDSRPTPPAPPAQALPLGKSVVALHEGSTYRSPPGFDPQVTVEVRAAGWVSTHRSIDAFDLSQPLPGEDAPLVVYAVLVPPEGSERAAIDAIKERAEAAGAEVEGGTAFTVTGGDGPLVTSRDNGIALDAVPGGYARFFVGTSGEPYVTVLWVPDRAREDDAERLRTTLDVVDVRPAKD
jgi:hypothetical protein